jgi:hypothetical protein
MRAPSESSGHFAHVDLLYSKVCQESKLKRFVLNQDFPDFYSSKATMMRNSRYAFVIIYKKKGYF